MRNHGRAAAPLFWLAAGALFGLTPAPAYATPPASPTDPTDAAIGQPALAGSLDGSLDGAVAGTLSPATGSPQRRAALDGLAALAARLPASAPSTRKKRIFDVDDYRVLREATIGDGFETYLIDPQALLSGKRLDQSLDGSGEWRFVVMVNGKGVGLISVARLNGKWSMVQAGASELAGEVVAVATRYAAQAPRARLRFVRSPQAVADFIEVSGADTATRNGQPVYVPLASARALLVQAQGRYNATGPVSAMPDTDLGNVLRPSVKRGLSDPTFSH